MLPILLAFLSAFSPADSPGFRGPDRSGVFAEKGLMRQWPQQGPPLRWSADGLGKGFSSVAVADGGVFTTGKIGGTGYLFRFDAGNGALSFKVAYGNESDGGGYEGARSTPTVDDGLVYVISGYGVVGCFEAAGGKQVWKVDTLARFGKGKKASELIPRWSIAESVLIIGDKLICTPGAPDATVVALDKKSGETIWTTEGLSDISGYCSARLFTNGDLRQIITMTGKSMVGIDPVDGTVMWRRNYEVSWGIHANSPLFHGNDIYVSDGYGQGGNMFTLAEDGSGVSLKWSEKKLDIHHGGGVLVDGKIYGADNRGAWIALDAETGEMLKRGRGVGKGSVIYADGLLYGYGERGRLGIIDPDAESLETISEIEIEKGSGQHWAHPVISDGALYIRHGEALMSFDIRAR